MNEFTPPQSRFQHTQVSLRLPAEILRQVDALATARFTNRASILRQILGTWAAGADDHTSCAALDNWGRFSAQRQ